MLITKFNKLIRSKILWGAIGFAMALTFVGSSVMSRSGGGHPADRGVEGRLFGREIDRDTFNEARLFELGLRAPADTSPAFLAAARERTWKRLASLQAAADMGIDATEEEVRTVLARDPSFSANGVFDPDRYRAILARELRVTPAVFERYVRQDLILRKLVSVLQSTTWTSPYEITPRLRRLTDVVDAACALLPEPRLDETAVSEDDARAYFEEHQDLFVLPEQRRVRYVAFPVSNYLSAVTVSDDAVAAWYDRHIGDYTTFDTNGVEQTTPLDEVRADIAGTVRGELAAFAARDAATDLVMAMAPDRYGRALTLDQAASAGALAIATSDWFAANEPVPGIEEGLVLTRAAASLVAGDPERYFSDPVLTTNAVYVLAALDRLDTRPATFEDVRDQALASARRLAEEDAHAAGLAAQRSALVDALAADSNLTFVAAADELGLAVQTTGAFTVYQGPADDMTNGQMLVAAILDLDAGEVSEPFMMGESNAVAAVISREAGDPTEADMLRPQFVRTLDQYRSAELFEAWRDSLLQEAELEDFRPVALDGDGESVPL